MPKTESHPAASGSWTEIATNIGSFHVAALGDAVVQTALPGTSRSRFLGELHERFPGAQFRPAESTVLREAARQLKEYGAGKRQSFDVPVHLEGTAFQVRVWNALAAIPYGEVRTYGEVAAAIGRPGASRAVGQANHNNPVAPIIPCHRVVAAGGGLGGYGGGLSLKRQMLDLEGVQLG